MEPKFVLTLSAKGLHEALVKINDRWQYDSDADDGIIFEAFVREIRQVMTTTQLSPDLHEIYIGFWGQATLTIPQSFFDLLAEIRLPVTLDLDD